MKYSMICCQCVNLLQVIFRNFESKNGLCSNQQGQSFLTFYHYFYWFYPECFNWIQSNFLKENLLTYQPRYIVFKEKTNKGICKGVLSVDFALYLTSRKFIHPAFVLSEACRPRHCFWVIFCFPFLTSEQYFHHLLSRKLWDSSLQDYSYVSPGTVHVFYDWNDNYIYCTLLLNFIYCIEYFGFWEGYCACGKAFKIDSIYWKFVSLVSDQNLKLQHIVSGCDILCHDVTQVSIMCIITKIYCWVKCC